MTDQELSTSDLAARSHRDDADSSLETEERAGHTTGAGATGDQDPIIQNSQADASLSRDPGADQPQVDEPHVGSRTAESRQMPGSGSGEFQTQTTSRADTDEEPLFPSDQRDRFTTRWQEIQTSFVDHPREAVAEADALIADLMQRLAASFSQERERLETQWDRGNDVSTEDLRVALTRYRSFFDRLLHA
jgi:hypothetical protein